MLRSEAKRRALKSVWSSKSCTYRQIQQTQIRQKAYKCLFLGYLKNMKGYRVWNLEARRLETTHSTKLQELQHSKYVEVVCCDKPMDRMNSMESQHYEEEDMPLERQHNSDDAMEIDEEFGEHDEHPGEDVVNMDIIQLRRLFPGGDWMVHWFSDIRTIWAQAPSRK